MDIRITNAYSAYGAQPIRNTTPGTTKPANTQQSGDTITLSAMAEDYKTVMKGLAAAPDVREDTISHLRDMIEQGTYNVSAQDVVANIFKTVE